MNRPVHGFTPDQWVDLVEGALDRDTAARMRAHVDSCPRCRETHDDLTLSCEQLRHLSARLASPDSSAARVHQAVLARIRMTQAAHAGQAIAIGVEQLRSILQPLCGQATTESAMRRAAQHCRAASAEEIGHAQWEPFVDRLGTIVDAICGASVAQWIAETARGIRWEAGA